MVRRRTAKLQRGELAVEDFLIKNVRGLLESLHGAGVKLYLASGTDQADLESEATAMGYAHLFEGRIFGAVGDVTVEAKRIVLEKLFREHGLAGPEVAAFGDGPVEIREARRRNGIAVGVASDEVRRFGLNPSKRARLIRGGGPDRARFLTTAGSAETAQHKELTTEAQRAQSEIHRRHTRGALRWACLSENALAKRDLNRMIEDSRLQLRAEITGYCPVQASGQVAGHELYFRARGNEWTFAIATGVETDPVDISSSEQGFFRSGSYGWKPAEAGWIPLDEAEKIIRECIAEFFKIGRR